MSSYRRAITEAIRRQLLGKTAAGANVLTSLDRPLNPKTDLPAIMIYTMTARRGKEDYGQTLIERLVTVGIEGAVLADAGREIESAEDMAAAIEDAIEADNTLGLVVNDCNWQQSISDATSHGGFTMGVCLLQYEVQIFTNQLPASAFEGDGPEHTPHLVNSVPDIVMPADPEPPRIVGDLACGPDGCDIPDWQGELPA